MPLGQFLSVRTEDHGDVSEDGRLVSQCPIKSDLFRCVGDMIVAADDVADSHRDVVAHHGEIVDRGVVAPQDHEVIEIPALKADASVDRIIPGDLLIIDYESDGGGSSALDSSLDLVRRQAVAPAVVAEGGARGLCLGPLRLELLAGAEATIGLAFRQETLGVGLVTGGVLALEEGTLVPGDAQPGESVENDPSVSLGAPLAISILDSQHEGPAAVLGVQPVEQRRSGTTDVEVARGRGREADAGRGHAER
jgi:hypothetical protein